MMASRDGEEPVIGHDQVDLRSDAGCSEDLSFVNGLSDLAKHVDPVDAPAPICTTY